jgi:hypothetical protein
VAYEEQQRQDDQQVLMDVLQALRSDPEKYQSVREALTQADSDEDKVRTLLNFATSERELASLIPARVVGEQDQLMSVTTVTVTTVFVLEGSAY